MNKLQKKITKMRNELNASFLEIHSFDDTVCIVWIPDGGNQSNEQWASGKSLEEAYKLAKEIVLCQ